MFEPIFNKVAGLKTCEFIEKRLQYRSFPIKFWKFLRTSFLKNICERLLPTRWISIYYINQLRLFYLSVLNTLNKITWLVEENAWSNMLRLISCGYKKGAIMLEKKGSGSILIHLLSMSHLYIPWKHQKAVKMIFLHIYCSNKNLSEPSRHWLVMISLWCCYCELWPDTHWSGVLIAE